MDLIVNDVVCVNKLKVKTVIGVHNWERSILQPLLIDVRMDHCFAAAASSDDLSDTLDYQKLCADIQTWCDQIQAKLIERLVVEIAERILAAYQPKQVWVKVIKPTAIKSADGVSVEVTRQNHVNSYGIS